MSLDRFFCPLFLVELSVPYCRLSSVSFLTDGNESMFADGSRSVFLERVDL